MADDDDDLVSLGTPLRELEDDAPPKKPVPVHEQIVTDEKGRRRFHGAFTGGFSAGYFNTVDTKEGWAPSTFVSSRSQRVNDASEQKPEDFMDEEDLGEYGIAPQRIVATEKFSSNKDTDRKRAQAGPSTGGRDVQQVDPLLKHLIVPVKMSIGTKLLTQMGWKEGQGVGPRVRQAKKKVYGCARPEDQQEDEEEDIYAIGLYLAPKDVDSVSFKSKDNMHGIGYSGINPRMALTSQHDWLGMDPAVKGKGVAGIKGQAFGVGAFEEDDEDIYTLDSMANYDIPSSRLAAAKKGRKHDSNKQHLYGWTGPPQASQGGGLLSIFTAATKPKPARKFYPPPVIPKDFKPFRKPAEDTEPATKIPPQQTQQTNAASKGTRLTAEDRGKILGEKPLLKPKKSVFDYVSKEDMTRLDSTKENSKSQVSASVALPQGQPSRRVGFSGSSIASGAFKPFVKDPAKQARYECFVRGDKTDTVATSGLTEWEREREQEEFARSAMLYRPLSQTMASRFTSSTNADELSTSSMPQAIAESSAGGTKAQATGKATKVFGPLTRQKFEWHPDRILCKRFNIPDPYPGSGAVGVPLSQKIPDRGGVSNPIPPPFKAIEAAEFHGTEIESGVWDQKEVEKSVETKGPLVEKKEHVKASNENEKLSRHKGQDDKPTSALLAGFASLSRRLKQTELEQSNRADVSESSAAGNVVNKDSASEKEKLEISDPNVVERPDMDIFKAIFADSSSEEESEKSDSEDDNGDIAAESESTRDTEQEPRDSDVQEPKANAKVAQEREESKIGVYSGRKEMLSGSAERTPGSTERTPINVETEHITGGENPQKESNEMQRLKFSLPSRSEKDVSPEIYGPSLPSTSASSRGSKQIDNSSSVTSRGPKEVDYSSSASQDDKSSDGYRDKKARKKKRRKKERVSSETDSSEDERRKKHRHKNKKGKEKKKRKTKDKDKTEKYWTEKHKSKSRDSSEYLEKTYDDASKTSKKKDTDKSKEKAESEKHKDRSEKHSKDRHSRGIPIESNDRGKGSLDKESRMEGSSDRVPGNSEIINKLKGIQARKEKKRMRASDFM